jgi:hypothetical protein
MGHADRDGLALVFHGRRAIPGPSIRFLKEGSILAAFDGFSEHQKAFSKTIFWDVSATPKEVAAFPG